MDFYEILARIIEVLQREGRTSYRALKRQFALDDDYLADLKVELIDVKRLAVDQDGTMLVRTGAAPTPSDTAPHLTPADALPVARPAADAERRQRTVLFCDSGRFHHALQPARSR